MSNTIKAFIAGALFIGLLIGVFLFGAKEGAEAAACPSLQMHVDENGISMDGGNAE